VKDLEAVRPSSILDIIYSGEAMAGMVKVDVKRPVQGKFHKRFCPVFVLLLLKPELIEHHSGKCTRCGSMSSQELCQACSLLETLNNGLAKVELSTSDVQRKALKIKV
jgi:cytoplasmic tRNA 2-thiolation protein 1